MLMQSNLLLFHLSTPLLFWAVMFLKPSDATSEESDGGGIAGDVSTNLFGFGGNASSSFSCG
jgi:hypothetical protein